MCLVRLSVANWVLFLPDIWITPLIIKLKPRKLLRAMSFELVAPHYPLMISSYGRSLTLESAV